MKIILQKDIHIKKEDFKKLEKLGFSIQYYNNEKVEADIYMGYPSQPFNELNNIQGLKFIQAFMVGFDQVDLDKIKEKEIVYANAANTSSVAIAEYVILKILDYFKNAQKFRDAQRNQHWISRPTSEEGLLELFNKNVLIMGSGSIGSAIAKRLQAFEANVVGVNRSGNSVEDFDKNVALDNLEKDIKEADVVVGCLPLNEESKDLYDKSFFTKMKKDAIFINVGRGQQVNEEDLLSIIDNHLAAVYLDVVKNEPLKKDSALWQHPKINITPHIAASSDNLKKRIIELAVDNAKRFKENKEIINRVI